MAGKSPNPLTNLWTTLDEIQIPEFVLLTLDEIQKRDDDAPWMWAMDNEPLEEHPCDLLSDIQLARMPL